MVFDRFQGVKKAVHEERRFRIIVQQMLHTHDAARVHADERFHRVRQRFAAAEKQNAVVHPALLRLAGKLG